VTDIAVPKGRTKRQFMNSEEYRSSSERQWIFLCFADKFFFPFNRDLTQEPVYCINLLFPFCFLVYQLFKCSFLVLVYCTCVLQCLFFVLYVSAFLLFCFTTETQRGHNFFKHELGTINFKARSIITLSYNNCSPTRGFTHFSKFIQNHWTRSRLAANEVTEWSRRYLLADDNVMLVFIKL
jgi:hypothetical protein